MVENTMKHFLSLLVLFFIATSIQAGDPPPLGVFRTQLVIGDPDRDWTYLWSRFGNISTKYSLVTKDGISIARGDRFHLGWTCEWWEQLYHGGFRPNYEALLPGNYRLDIGRGPESAISVITRKPRKEVTIAPGASADKIQGALNAGYNLVLSPGLYEWNHAIILPDFSSIRGTSVYIKRLPNNDYMERMFVAGENCTLAGLMLETPGNVVHSSKPVQGLVVKDCRLIRCDLGWGPSSVLIKDCVFDRSSCNIAPGGLYLRCRWENTAQDRHAFCLGGPSKGQIALIDCTFDATDRGPIFNALYGAITDGLFIGIRCHGINYTTNGNEIFLCEGTYEFSRHLFFHIRVWGCDSATFQFDHVARNNYARDVSLNGGIGLFLWGEEVTDNTFEDFEFRNGAGILLTEGAIRNTFINGAVIAWSPSRGNQTWMNPSAMDRREPIKITGKNAANKLTNVRVLSMPADAVVK